jgi:hypothetical protein
MKASVVVQQALKPTAMKEETEIPHWCGFVISPPDCREN